MKSTTIKIQPQPKGFRTAFGMQRYWRKPLTMDLLDVNHSPAPWQNMSVGAMQWCYPCMSSRRSWQTWPNRLPPRCGNFWPHCAAIKPRSIDSWGHGRGRYRCRSSSRLRTSGESSTPNERRKRLSENLTGPMILPLTGRDTASPPCCNSGIFERPRHGGS